MPKLSLRSVTHAFIGASALLAASCTTVYVKKCDCAATGPLAAAGERPAVSPTAPLPVPRSAPAKVERAVARNRSGSPLVTAVGTASVASQSQIPQSGEFAESSPATRVVSQYENGLKHGAESGWRRDAAQSKWFTGSYDSGEMSGVWTTWYADGQVQSTREYVAGKLTGAMRTYHPNGQMETESIYANGLDVAPTRGWYPNGKIEFEMPYVNGLRQGEAVWYREDGTVRARGAYVDGKLHGTYTEFDRGGTAERTERWDRGTLGDASPSSR